MHLSIIVYCFVHFNRTFALFEAKSSFLSNMKNHNLLLLKFIFNCFHLPAPEECVLRWHLGATSQHPQVPRSTLVQVKMLMWRGRGKKRMEREIGHSTGLVCNVFLHFCVIDLVQIHHDCFLKLIIIKQVKKLK